MGLGLIPLLCCDSVRARMKLPYMADQCEQMLKISSEFVRLQVSHDEYLCMKVLLLLSTGTLPFVFSIDLSSLDRPPGCSKYPPRSKGSHMDVFPHSLIYTLTSI